MCLVLTFENLGRKALHLTNPFQITSRSGEPSIGALINLALLAALLIGFAFSLGGRRERTG